MKVALSSVMVCLVFLAGCATDPEPRPADSGTAAKKKPAQTASKPKSSRQTARQDAAQALRDHGCFAGGVADQILAEAYKGGMEEGELRQRFAERRPNEKSRERVHRSIDRLVATPNLNPVAFGYDSYVRCTDQRGIRRGADAKKCFRINNFYKTVLIYKQRGIPKARVKAHYRENVKDMDAKMANVINNVVDRIYGFSTDKQVYQYMYDAFRACSWS